MLRKDASVRRGSRGKNVGHSLGHRSDQIVAAANGPAGYSLLAWGTNCGKGGPTMAPWMVRPDQLKRHRWSGGTTCGSHNRSGGTDYGGTGCGMTVPPLHLRLVCCTYLLTR